MVHRNNHAAANHAVFTHKMLLVMPKQVSK